MASVDNCNVLELEGERRHLWRFSTGGGKVNAAGEAASAPPTPLPEKWVKKDWHSLFQRTLNIAWLPADKVFVRVVQVPPCEPSELPAMVEFQLEKISPLPVAQIVWTAAPVPSQSTLPQQMQTVIVLIVASGVVEEYLGKLENQSYLADRLELPFVHELFSITETGTAAWLFPRRVDGKVLCLGAWYQSGVLKNVGLIHLSAGENWRKELEEQLTQVAWAGEMEGWLTSETRWNIVAEPDLAAEWQQVVSAWSGKEVKLSAPVARPKIAALSAQYAARHEKSLNLIPVEYATRYSQQFVDRLWMRGAGLVIGIYIVAVAIYIGALQWKRFQLNGLETRIAELTPQYNKSMELQARVQVLQEQISLRYAALDSLRAVAEKLPDGVTLTTFNFSRGKDIELRGNSDSQSKVQDFTEKLSRYSVDGSKPLFTDVGSAQISIRPSDQAVIWSVTFGLNKGIE